MVMSSLPFCNSSLPVSHWSSLYILTYLTLILWDHYSDHPDFIHDVICLLSQNQKVEELEFEQVFQVPEYVLKHNIIKPDPEKQIFYCPWIFQKKNGLLKS